MLTGITVLDFSIAGPGPRCTRILADYGARVIKVRPPADTDLMQIGNHLYSADRDIDRVGVDLKSGGGLAVAERLIQGSDVVIESFRPGVAARLGIGFDDAVRLRPNVVYCSISGYGQDCPASKHPGHDLNYLGVAGYLALSGHNVSDAPPLPGASIADAAGGFCAAIAVLAALYERQGSDSAKYLDLSITDAALRFTQMWIDQELAGQNVLPSEEMLLGGRACYGIYEAADGKWLTVGAVEQRFWTAFCEAIGLGHLWDRQHDPAAQSDVRKEVQEVLGTKTRDEWLALLGPVTAVGPVNSITELLVDPVLNSRELVWSVRTDTGDSIRQLAPRLAGGPKRPSANSQARSAGFTTTDRVLTTLGYKARELRELHSSGAIF
jgi:alpha-methylacyl-CoA racemase